MGEFAGLKQTDAILKALKQGPHTTRELFDRLNNGGQAFKKVAYVTSVLARMTDRTERLPDGRVAIKQAA